MFSTGFNPFVAIVGPSGWGKTHLLNAVAYRLSMDGKVACDPIPVRDYLASPAKGEAAPSLILDDVQEVLVKARQRVELRMALERRLKMGRPTILALTHAKPSRQIKNFLPGGRDWTIAAMGEPLPAEREQLFSQMSAAEGLILAPRLIRMLADQMHGNGRTISGALKRLRLSGSTWIDANETLKAIGVLDPFFADNSAWDLKMKVLRIAEQSRAQFTRTAPLDLALYTMNHVAGLSENDVARSASITPAEAYQRVNRFKQQVETCETTSAQARRFAELVVESLTKE